MSMIPSFDDFDEPAFVPHDILFPEDTDASSDSTPPEPDAIGISKEELVDKLLPAFLSMVRATSQVVLRVTQKRLDREAAERESQEEEEEDDDDKIKTIVCRVEFEGRTSLGTRLIEIQNPDDITLDKLKGYFFEQCVARHQLRNEGRYEYKYGAWEDNYCTDKDGVPIYDGLKLVGWLPYEKHSVCIQLDLESEWKTFWQACRDNIDDWGNGKQILFRANLFKTAERMAYEKEVKMKQEEDRVKQAMQDELDCD